MSLVENTAPWLFATGPSSFPWTPIFEAARSWQTLDESSEDEWLRYFVLCLAAHHTTVASFVPTDVDSKIRGLAWRNRKPETVEKMIAATFDWMTWDVDAVSARVVHTDQGPISGIDGERLSVLMGALNAAYHVERTDLADAVGARIEAELAREAEAFKAVGAAKGRELDALRIAAVMTHNVGDVDQGISFWPKSGPTQPWRTKFGRLAHENKKPFGGAFHRAAEVYKHTLSCEGHRNYPLRGVKSLRQSRDLLLPMAPFLDEWGALVARHPALSDEDRGEVVAALVSGCHKLGAQFGYYRALAGIAAAKGRGLHAYENYLSAASRRQLGDAELRKQVTTPAASFESSMKKKARQLLGS